MSKVRGQNSISTFTLIFLLNQAALLTIAIYADSTAAFVFFWLGIGIFLSCMEPAELRANALAYWLGLTFAILGYAIYPVTNFNHIKLSSDPQVVLGQLLYVAAIVTLFVTLIWPLLSTQPSDNEPIEQDTHKR